EIAGWPRYDAPSVSDDPTAPLPVPESPIDPLYTHAASPFLRTSAPTPVAFASPPAAAGFAPLATWTTYTKQIQLAFAILTFLLVLVGSVTVVEANSDVSWKYAVAAIRIVPAALVVWLFVRAVSRRDEEQKRIQVEGHGVAMAAAADTTYAHGGLRGVSGP